MDIYLHTCDTCQNTLYKSQFTQIESSSLEEIKFVIKQNYYVKIFFCSHRLDNFYDQISSLKSDRGIKYMQIITDNGGYDVIFYNYTYIINFGIFDCEYTNDNEIPLISKFSCIYDYNLDGEYKRLVEKINIGRLISEIKIGSIIIFKCKSCQLFFDHVKNQLQTKNIVLKHLCKFDYDDFYCSNRSYVCESQTITTKCAINRATM